MRSVRSMMWMSALVALFGAGCQGDEKDPVDDTDESEETDSELPPDDTDTEVPPDDTDLPDPTCWVDSDVGQCWDCELPEAPEADSEKALNQCNTASYVVFENAARIPAATWVPGTPLPPVP